MDRYQKITMIIWAINFIIIIGAASYLYFFSSLTTCQTLVLNDLANNQAFRDALSRIESRE